MKRSPNQNLPPQNLNRLLRNGVPLNREERSDIRHLLEAMQAGDNQRVMEASVLAGGLRLQAIRTWQGLDELTTRLYRRMYIIGAEEPQPRNDGGGRRWWAILARLLMGLIVLALWGPVVAAVECAIIALAWRPIALARREVANGFRGAVNVIGRVFDQEVIRSKRRLYLRSGRAYRQLVGVTGFLLATIYLALEAHINFAQTPVAYRPGWGVLYGLFGLVYLGLWGALVVDTWRQLATPKMRRAAAAAGRVLRVAVSVPVWPIKFDLDRAVRQDGFDPTSLEGRLHRLAIVRRILVWGTALNVACALSAPATVPLLMLHPGLWAVFLFEARRERRRAAVAG